MKHQNHIASHVRQHTDVLQEGDSTQQVKSPYETVEKRGLVHHSAWRKRV